MNIQLAKVYVGLADIETKLGTEIIPLVTHLKIDSELLEQLLKCEAAIEKHLDSYEMFTGKNERTN